VVAIPLAAVGLVVPGVLSLGTVALVDVGLGAWLNVGAGMCHWVAECTTGAVSPLPTPGATLAEVVVLSVGVVIGLIVLRWRGDGSRRARRRRWVVAGLAASLVAAPALARRLPGASADVAQVTFLAVGHGDAVVIQLPGGRNVLIDGGGDPTDRVDVGARVVLPALAALGVRHIDLMVLSHPHPDHFGGLAAVAAALPVSVLWTSGLTAVDPRFAELMRRLRVQGTEVRPVRAGMAVGLAGARFEVLHPAVVDAGLGANENSVVVRVTFGRFRLLLTGDVERHGEAALLASGADLRATVLKAPHHGSRTSSSRALLRAVRPALAVAQSADRGRFAFPHGEVETRYGDLGIPLWITGRYGAARIRTDGATWTVDGFTRPW